MWSLTYCLQFADVPHSQLGRLNSCRLKGQFSFYTYLVLCLLLATTIYHSVLYIHFFNRSWVNHTDLWRWLKLGCRESGQCRAINTNQPVEHKATRVGINHKVTPCSISLQCQQRIWPVVALIYGDQKKEYKCISLCLLCLLFCSFSGIKDFSLSKGSGLWVQVC